VIVNTSQRIAATLFQCGGISDYCLITNLLVSTVNKNVSVQP